MGWLHQLIFCFLLLLLETFFCILPSFCIRSDELRPPKATNQNKAYIHTHSLNIVLSTHVYIFLPLSMCRCMNCAQCKKSTSFLSRHVQMIQLQNVIVISPGVFSSFHHRHNNAINVLPSIIKQDATAQGQSKSHDAAIPPHMPSIQKLAQHLATQVLEKTQTHVCTVVTGSIHRGCLSRRARRVCGQGQR